jgi:prolyl oligopeptidase
VAIPSPLRLLLCLCLFAGLLAALSAMDIKPPLYPPSRVEKLVETLHGVEVADPYRWLEDGGSPEVRDWTEKQNACTRSLLDALPARDRIQTRLGALLEIGSLATPVPVKGRYFYTRRDGQQNQPILYVREDAARKDRILLDPNQLAADGSVAIDWWYPSRDGKLLAYGLSKDGTEQSTLYLLEVATGKGIPETIEQVRACSVAWLPDSTGFYYTRYPRPGSVPEGQENYHRHVYLHRLGDEPADDVKVFGDGRAPEDWPNVALSPDGRWLVVTVQQGWTKSEIYFKDTTKKGAPFVPLVEKVNALFSVVVRNDRFYVHTNDQAPRYRVFEVNPLEPEREEWVEIIPEGKDVLDTIASIGDTLVTLSLHRASSRLQLHDRNGNRLREVELPMLGTVTGLGGEWNGSELLFGFQSFTLPPSIYRVDLKNHRMESWERLTAEIDFGTYEVEQVSYRSRDGTPVSMFLAHKKDIVRDGKTPALLHGYGGFNHSLTPSFNAARFLFLEKGGLLAIANLRGGGEQGEEWHQAGMLGRKQNVFNDFVAAAEWLMAQGWTDREHLAIQGGSNGGLLIGAAVTQRPELFRAAVCQAPLLDMLRYHRFQVARLWIPEYGSSEDPEQFRWLHAYSPYHRVRDRTPYPALLLMAAEGDTRVDPLHARKMTARLQAATSSEQPILLRLETKAGHGAGKPRTRLLEELTDTWSFLFWQLGIKG